jgi:benzylsuccinate CoA-transferase BbsF subunit
VTAIGSPAWAADAKLATVNGRKDHEDDLERQVTEWTRQLDRDEVVARLREHDLRVYPVNSMEDLFTDPQLAARQEWRPVDHPVQGRIHAHAPPFLLRDTLPTLDRPAPSLGGDNTYVLSEIIGLSGDEIEDLARQGVLD